MAGPISRFLPGRRVAIIDLKQNGSRAVPQLNRAAIHRQPIGGRAVPRTSHVRNSVIRPDQVWHPAYSQIGPRGQHRTLRERIANRSGDAVAADVLRPRVGIEKLDELQGDVRGQARNRAWIVHDLGNHQPGFAAGRPWRLAIHDDLPLNRIGRQKREQ